MQYEAKTTEWNREAKRAAETMATFRNSTVSKEIAADKGKDGLMVVLVETRGRETGTFNSLYIGWCSQGEIGGFDRTG